MIIFIIIAVVLLILFIYFSFQKHFILQCFKSGNCIVFGKKGKGKDLLFSLCTHNRKHFSYLMPYNKKSIVVRDLKVFDLSPNTFENFINGNIEKIPNPLKEDGVDLFITDGGVVLPSQYDSILHKKYKSFPIAYALSRQLWNMNIHINSQALNRVWLSLREQADSYIKIEKNIKLPFFILVKYVYYDRYSTALQDIRPFKKTGITNDYSKAEVSIHKSLYGTIKSGWVCLLKKNIKYDTRFYKKVIFK